MVPGNFGSRDPVTIGSRARRYQVCGLRIGDAVFNDFFGSWRGWGADPRTGGGWFLRKQLVRRRWSGCPAVLDHRFGRCRSDHAPSSSGDGRPPSPCRGAGQSGTAEPFTRLCAVLRPKGVRLRTAGGQGGGLFGGRFPGTGISGRALRRPLTDEGLSGRHSGLVGSAGGTADLGPP